MLTSFPSGTPFAPVRGAAPPVSPSHAFTQSVSPLAASSPSPLISSEPKTTLAGSTLVESPAQLVAWMEACARPGATDPLFSLTSTFFVHQRESLLPVPHQGENSLTTLLDELQAFRWKACEPPDSLTTLSRGAEEMTLGPGGQLITTGGVQADVHAIADTLFHQLDEIGSVSRILGQRLLAIGFAPAARREQMPRLARADYHILAAHLNETGSLGLDMMARCAGAHVATSFSSERDLVARMRLALALQPVVGALFACSPFRDARPSGELSFRNRVWQHTDPTRCAYLEFVFDDGFGFEAYVNWALSIPLAFLRRGPHMIDITGASFRDLMTGRVSQAPGVFATLDDWEDHLETLTPPVRLGRLMEMRGADMGPARMEVALAALWAGLLGDPVAQDEAWQLVRHWTAGDRLQLYADGPAKGLQATVGGKRLHDVARELVMIATTGLKRRARLNLLGQDERIHLAPLSPLIERGLTQAEDLIRLYCDDWSGRIDPVFDVCGVG